MPAPEAPVSEIDILADRGTTPEVDETPDQPVETDEAPVEETSDAPEESTEESSEEQTDESTEESPDADQEAQPEGEEAPEGELEEPEEVTPQAIADSETLAELYQDVPALKSFLKEHPEARPAFFRAAEINKLYPTVEDAKMAREWSRDLYKFEQLYTGSADDKRAFIQSLWDNNLDANGRSQGHYEAISRMMVGDTVGRVEQEVSNLLNSGQLAQVAQAIGLKNPGQVQVAVEVFKRLLNQLDPGAASEPSAVPSRAGVNGGANSFEQRLSAREAEITRREAEFTSRAQDNFNNNVRQSFRTWLTGAVDKQLKQASGLSAIAKKTPGITSMVESTIMQKTLQTIYSDDFFTDRIDAMVRGKTLDETLARQVSDAIAARARVVLPRVTSSVLRDIGVQLVAKSSAARDVASSGGRRREPQMSGTPGRLSRAPGNANARKPKDGESYEQFSNRILNEE